MRASRAVVERLVAEGRTAYGVTTGFGDLADVRIEPAQTAELQRNLVRSHAAGVGEPLPAEVVRAMLLLRANALAVGLSGVRPEVVELLIGMLNHQVHPVVPSRGSVGASGDLAPLAHLALVVIGEGEAWVDQAGPGSGAEALEQRRAAAVDPGGQGGPGAAERHAADGRAGCPGAGRRAAAGGLGGRHRCHEPGGDARHGLGLRPGADRGTAASGPGGGGGPPPIAAGRFGDRRLARRERPQGPGRLLVALHAAGARRGARRARPAGTGAGGGDERGHRQPARLPVGRGDLRRQLPRRAAGAGHRLRQDRRWPSWPPSPSDDRRGWWTPTSPACLPS